MEIDHDEGLFRSCCANGQSLRAKAGSRFGISAASYEENFRRFPIFGPSCEENLGAFFLGPSCEGTSLSFEKKGLRAKQTANAFL
jgi:hypothetical protein